MAKLMSQKDETVSQPLEPDVALADSPPARPPTPDSASAVPASSAEGPSGASSAEELPATVEELMNARRMGRPCEWVLRLRPGDSVVAAGVAATDYFKIGLLHDAHGPAPRLRLIGADLTSNSVMTLARFVISTGAATMVALTCKWTAENVENELPMAWVGAAGADALRALSVYRGQLDRRGWQGTEVVITLEEDPDHHVGRRGDRVVFPPTAAQVAVAIGDPRNPPLTPNMFAAIVDWILGRDCPDHLEIRPRGAGQGDLKGERIGEASRPGPPKKAPPPLRAENRDKTTWHG